MMRMLILKKLTSFLSLSRPDSKSDGLFKGIFKQEESAGKKDDKHNREDIKVFFNGILDSFAKNTQCSCD